MGWRQLIAIGLGAVFAAAAALFLFYTYRGAPSEHSLMNVEAILAVAFLAILLLRSRTAPAAKEPRDITAPAIAAGLIFCVVVLAFAGALRSPFLYDDYTHLTDAAADTLRVAAAQFRPVAHPPGLFFRPFGFFLYWLNYLWAGTNPLPWHAASVALHAMAAFLVYLLCAAIGTSRFAAFSAALLFAVNGAAAETVAWIDARFDLMATSLVLLSILLTCRYLRTAHLAWLVASLAVAAAAMLTKEAAFCLPLLIVCLSFFLPASERRRIWTAGLSSGLLAAALFVYRWWALGGIGGYRSPAGAPYIAQFNLLHSLNGLFLREWAILFFPFNWSLDRGAASQIALTAIPLLIAVCALTSRASSRRLLGTAAFVIAASLPVQHLLLMDSALSGSRNLYLATAGWAMLWAVILEGMSWKLAAFSATLLLATQLAMLEHNLRAWNESADLARSVCTAFGQTAAAGPGVVVVSGLPDTHNGAVFLHNGFPQCVEMNSGFPASRILVREPGEPRPAWVGKEYVWNGARHRFEESTR